MKKIFCFIICIISLIVFCTTAFGSGAYEYGQTFFSLKMNGTLDDESYWYIYYGKSASELSTEKAYEGKTALKCDISELDQTKDYPFMFHTRPVSNKNGIEENAICFELYTSSSDIVFNNLTLAVYFEMSDGSERILKNFVTEQVNDDWKRSYCIINPKNYDGFKECKIGVLFKKNTNLSGCFYIDNINMKVCPVSLAANDVYTSDDLVNLNDIRVFGVDNNSSKSIVGSHDLIKWRVVSGSAEIADNMLSYHGSKPGDVVVEADFLSKKTTFSIHFENKDIYLSAMPAITDNNVSLTVVNNGSQNIHFYGCILIYEGNKLFNVHILEKNINAGQSETLSKDINIPAVLENLNVKFIYWNSLGDMSEVLDVN